VPELRIVPMVVELEIPVPEVLIVPELRIVTMVPELLIPLPEPEISPTLFKAPEIVPVLLIEVSQELLV